MLKLLKLKQKYDEIAKSMVKLKTKENQTGLTAHLVVRYGTISNRKGG